MPTPSKPQNYADDDLVCAFWNVNRDKYPERYDELKDELERRGIEMPDLEQWERHEINYQSDSATANFIFGILGRIGKLFSLRL